MQRLAHLVLALPLLTACSEPAPSNDAPAPAEPQTKPPAAPEPAPYVPYLEPDAAFLAIPGVGGGVTRIAADGSTKTLRIDSPSSGAELLDLFAGPKRRVYALTAEALLIDEESAFIVEREFNDDNIGAAYSAAVDHKGGIWVAGTHGVGRYADRKWTVTPKASVGEGLLLTPSVVVDARGWAWLLTGSTVYQPTGERAWSKLDVELPPQSNGGFLKLGATLGGEVYLHAGDYLAFAKPEGIKPIALRSPNPAMPYVVSATSPTGKIVLANYECDIVRIDPADPSKVWQRAGKPNWGCERLSALAIDGQDRVWVSSRAGTQVLGPDDQVVNFPTGSFYDFIGHVQAIVVLGKGPSLPTPSSTIRTGHVAGTITIAGEVVANAPFELCHQVDYAAEQEPCAGSHNRFVGKTDKQGRFEVENVPFGNYEISVKHRDRWTVVSLPEDAREMRDGQLHTFRDSAAPAAP